MGEANNITDFTADITKSKLIGNRDTNESEDKLDLPIVVKTYFTLIKEDGNFIDAKCNLCKPRGRKKPIRGQFKVPSNLTNILRYDMLFKHGMGWC